jgi:hypothetical protein
MEAKGEKRLINLRSFVSDVVSSTTTHEVCQVRIPDFAQPLHVMILGRHSSGAKGTPLVVCFHGALDQAKRKVPAFEGRFLLMNGVAGEATIISIADPSMMRQRELRASWFAGDEETDTPAAIGALVSELVRSLEPVRLVFVGGSTGAHPALVQSFKVPGSVAVVENPILHISRYHARHVSKYRQVCWPRLAEKADLPASTYDNVADLYRKGHENAVVLLSNARDPHFWLQGAQLLNAIARSENRDRCLLYSDVFADYPGHSFPQSLWARWVKAACGAESASVADIGNRYAVTLPAPSRERRPAEPSVSDIETSRRIYHELMTGDLKA